MTDETKPTVTAPWQIWAWASFDDDGDWYNANARDVGDTGGQQYIRADIHLDTLHEIFRLYRLAFSAHALIATMSGGDPDLRKAYDAIK